MSAFYTFYVNDLSGNAIDFNEFKGRPVLIVNTASACGLTPQFAGLEQLNKAYPELVIIGFPCNQFGAQEPNEGLAIEQFCQANYGVTFLMANKLDVNGADAHPLFVWLKAQTGGDEISWNFAKFLLNKEGEVVARFDPKADPMTLQTEIDKIM